MSCESQHHDPLEGRLLAIQNMIMMLYDAHVFHSEKPPSKEAMLKAFSKTRDKIGSELSGPAQEAFYSTMDWFDIGLALGSQFPETEEGA